MKVKVFNHPLGSRSALPCVCVGSLRRCLASCSNVASSSLKRMIQHSIEHNLHCFVVVPYPLAVAKMDQVTSWAMPLSFSSQMYALKVVPFCSLLLKLPLWPVVLFLAVFIQFEVNFIEVNVLRVLVKFSFLLFSLTPPLYQLRPELHTVVMSDDLKSSFMS